MGKDIFISYSRKDYLKEDNTLVPGSIVSEIIKCLDDNKFDYWIDMEGKYDGDNFMQMIADKIDDSKLLLFISSKNSNASEWTNKEISYAFNKKKQIIPILIDDTPFQNKTALLLSDIDRIDYYKTHSFDELVKSLNDKLDQIKLLESFQRRRSQLTCEIEQLLGILNEERVEIEKAKTTLKGLVSIYNSNIRRMDICEDQLQEIDKGYKRKDSPHVAITDYEAENDNNLATIKSLNSKLEENQREAAKHEEETKKQQSKLKKQQDEIDKLNSQISTNSYRGTGSGTDSMTKLFRVWFVLGLVVNIYVFALMPSESCMIFQAFNTAIWLYASLAKLFGGGGVKIAIACILYVILTVANFNMTPQLLSFLID